MTNVYTEWVNVVHFCNSWPIWFIPAAPPLPWTPSPPPPSAQATPCPALHSARVCLMPVRPFLQIRSVNKTDVMTMLSAFGNFRRLADLQEDDLLVCPGLGEKKVDLCSPPQDSAAHASSCAWDGAWPHCVWRRGVVPSACVCAGQAHSGGA